MIKKKTNGALSFVTKPNPLPDVTGSEAAFQKFEAAARAIDAKSVTPFRGDAMIVYHNVARGRDSVLAERGRLEAELPNVDVDALDEIGDIALGLVFAASQVNRNAKTSPAKARLPLARKQRNLLLKWAEALAASGFFDANEVKKIPSAQTPTATAQGLIELAALYRRNPDVLSVCGVEARDITDASNLGTELVRLLKPANLLHGAAPPHDVLQAADLRDRMFTLLSERHDVLRRAGAYLFGLKALDERIPPLLSSARPRARTKKAHPPAVVPVASAPPSAGSPMPASAAPAGATNGTDKNGTVPPQEVSSRTPSMPS